ncbi:hypothetical protein KBC55_04540 [Patescibacteria group bacterium]|nr:hypothetical protein [Patescibacteria group bacterium]
MMLTTFVSGPVDEPPSSLPESAFAPEDTFDTYDKESDAPVLEEIYDTFRDFAGSGDAEHKFDGHGGHPDTL